MKNGGFEEGLEPWRSFSYWPQCPMNATVAEVTVHSGRYSLFVGAGQSGQGSIATVIFDRDGSISTITTGASSGYCVGGGGAYQIVPLGQNSNLKFSGWVYLKGVSGETTGTDISIVLWFLTEGTPRILAYYVAWSKNVPIYKNFPAPTASSENVTSILIQNVRYDRWNYVELDLERDFKESYPNIDFSSIHQLTVQLISAGIKGGGATAGAFWDDVSLTYKRVSATTPEPTSSPTPVPASPTSPTPIPSSPEETQQIPIGSAMEQWLLPIAVIGIIVVALGGALALKRKSPKTVVPTVPEESATEEKRLKLKEYCYYCGAPMPEGAKFCKKCGKKQSQTPK